MKLASLLLITGTILLGETAVFASHGAARRTVHYMQVTQTKEPQLVDPFVAIHRPIGPTDGAYGDEASW